MKGIVFEVLDDKATILKNDGGFLEVPAQKGWESGDLVTVQARRIRFPAIIAIAASMMFVFASLFTVFTVSNNPATLISMDINPSIEISVNRFGKVISAKARNDEGTELLDAVDVSGMPYAEAVLQLMESGAMDPYLADNDLLVFSVQANNEAWQQELLATLRSSTDSYISSRHSGTTTEYFIVDGQIVTEAHRHGVTPGKYMLLLELESLASDVNIEEYTHHSVGDIQAEIDAHHRHGFGKNNEDIEHGTANQATDSEPSGNGHGNDIHGGGHNGGHD